MTTSILPFRKNRWFLLFSISLLGVQLVSAKTEVIALWLFDEQKGIYPSCVLSDSSQTDFPLVLGPGGQIVSGKFGNALESIDGPKVNYPEGNAHFGLTPVTVPEGHTVEPMTWKNANFSALATSGENHLRKEVGFLNASKSRLNLGDFDWTVEFWYLPSRKSNEEGAVFEIGQGPRGENEHVTRLVLNKNQTGFILLNEPGGLMLKIPSDKSALLPGTDNWRHLAFVYDSEENQIRHFVDGVEQFLPSKGTILPLGIGEESYFSIGRDGLWERAIPGRIDELRISAGRVYQGNFTPPSSLSPTDKKKKPEISLLAGPPLLFPENDSIQKILPIGGRKHLFIDDAIVEEMENIHFQLNPPRLAERVIDNIKGSFRKHLTVIEDDEGLIRIYNGVKDDQLGVRTSKDGIHWQVPDMSRSEDTDYLNIVIPESVAVGSLFLDPNASSESRWKYFSGYHDRGIFMYSSADGWSFRRNKTAALPFRSGSQSFIYYDDQRQRYVAFHRTDYPRTIAGATQREFVRTETIDINAPWPFKPATQSHFEEVAKNKRMHKLNPWYLDNGPLTPGGFGFEYPTGFAPDDSVDPVGTDFYSPKAVKYAWAPDTYLAFPVVYFHYERDGPATRQILGEEDRGRGSGPIETQLAVSRDGLNWKRFPRPAYIGVGNHLGRDIHQAYIANGLIRRGNEIWQYYYGEDIYHSTFQKGSKGSAVYRVVQRFDGFVSADSPYDKVANLRTKPLIFRGNRLVLNIDTEATGYAQVGLLDMEGNSISGYSVDDCIYINGDFMETEVEWMGRGTDLSELQGKPVRIEFLMRGSKLYSMQFRD